MFVVSEWALVHSGKVQKDYNKQAWGSIKKSFDKNIK